MCCDKRPLAAVRAPGEALLWSGSLGKVSLTYKEELTEEENSQ